MSAVKEKLCEQDWFAHEIHQAEEFIVHGLEKEIRARLHTLRIATTKLLYDGEVKAASNCITKVSAYEDCLNMLSNYGELKGE